MHQAAFPGEDICDRPLPEDVAVPGILALLDRRPPSGRYRAADLLARRVGGGLVTAALDACPATVFRSTATCGRCAARGARPRPGRRPTARRLRAVAGNVRVDAHDVRRPRRPPAPGRPARRQQLGDRRRRGRRTGAGRGSGRRARRDRARRRHLGRRAAHRARRARPGARRGRGDVVDLAGGRAPAAPRARPTREPARRRPVTATGCGGRRARRCTPREHLDDARPADRLRLPPIAASRSRTTRRSSPGCPAAPRWRAPRGRSPPTS